MSDQRIRLAALDDEALAATLRAGAESIAWPTAAAAGAPDIATRVRMRLVAAPRPAARRPWTAWRPVRRSLVLALVALLLLAAIAGAVGLGLPGLHLILGGPLVSPPPSASPGQTIPAGGPGSTLGLGTPVALDAVEAATGIAPRLPTDPAIGPPDVVYVDRARGNQVAYVWASRPGLPETGDPGVGLILMQFDGQTDSGYHEKLINLGTTVEPVNIDGRSGFWISGDPHFFFYRHPGDPSDATINDDRRWVGDALLWADGPVTYRIESALGRDATIAIARSLQ
jgi:hypothetical protein